MNNQPLLFCSQLSKCYQEEKIYTNVLHNVNFSLQPSDMIAIVGTSGSGKSTLLHLLGGLDEPSSGEVIFEGQPINKLSSVERAKMRNCRLGFIYQFHHLLSDFNVLENVAMPLMIGGTKSVHAKQMAREILAAVKLEQRWQYRPSELSGGERQRVAIARALVNHPSLVLADEPTGNLDQRNADRIFNLLEELNIRHGTAFLVVTHDLMLAKRLPRQLEMHDGSLQDFGSH